MNNTIENLRESDYYDELLINLYSEVKPWFAQGLGIYVGKQGHNEYSPAYFTLKGMAEYAIGTSSRFTDKTRFMKELKIFRATRECQMKVWRYTDV